MVAATVAAAVGLVVVAVHVLPDADPAPGLGANLGAAPAVASEEPGMVEDEPSPPAPVVTTSTLPETLTITLVGEVRSEAPWARSIAFEFPHPQLEGITVFTRLWVRNAFLEAGVLGEEGEELELTYSQGSYRGGILWSLPSPSIEVSTPTAEEAWGASCPAAWRTAVGPADLADAAGTDGVDICDIVRAFQLHTVNAVPTGAGTLVVQQEEISGQVVSTTVYSSGLPTAGGAELATEYSVSVLTTDPDLVRPMLLDLELSPEGAWAFPMSSVLGDLVPPGGLGAESGVDTILATVVDVTDSDAAWGQSVTFEFAFPGFEDNTVIARLWFEEALPSVLETGTTMWFVRDEDGRFRFLDATWLPWPVWLSLRETLQPGCEGGWGSAYTDDDGETGYCPPSPPNLLVNGPWNRLDEEDARTLAVGPESNRQSGGAGGTGVEGEQIIHFDTVGVMDDEEIRYYYLMALTQNPGPLRDAITALEIGPDGWVQPPQAPLYEDLPDPITQPHGR